MKYLRLLFIVFIYIISVSTYGQFTPMVGILAGSSAYQLDMDNIYISQISNKYNPGTYFATGGDINLTGTWAISTGSSVDLLMWLELATAHDFTTATWTSGDTRNIDTDDAGAQVNGVRFGDSDDKIFIADYGNDGLQEYSLATTGNPNSTLTHNGLRNLPTTSNELSVDFNGDGTKIYISTLNSDDIDIVSASTGWDFSTGLTYDGSETLLVSVAGTADNADLSISNDGYQIMYQDEETYDIYTISLGTLTTAYDFSTLTKNVSTKSWNNITGKISSFTWKSAQDYGLEFSYGGDYLAKYRDITLDNPESSKAYEFTGDVQELIRLNAALVDIEGTAISFVFDVAIPASGPGSVNELFGATANNNIRIWHDGVNDRVRVSLNDGTNSSTIDTASSTLVGDGNYTQIVITYSTSTGLEVYIDGTSSTSNSDTDFLGFSGMATNQKNERALHVAGRFAGTNVSYGKYRNVQVYNKELTSTEVSDLWTDITDTAASLEINLADQKGDYFWVDETGNNHHGGAESVSKVAE